MKKILAGFVRQSPALVVAMLALFVALTSTAVATTSALITGRQIKNGSITGVDVKNKSLTPKDFRGSVRGPRGFTGAPGVKGDKGDKGDRGDPGPSNVYGTFFCALPGCASPPKELTASTWDAADFFLTLNLPAGAYSIHGNVIVAAPPDGDSEPLNDSDWRVECTLRVPLTGPGYAGGASATVGPYPGDAMETTLPIVFGANLPSGGTLGLKCIRGVGSGAEGQGPNPKVMGSEITAIRAGSLN